MRVSYRQEVLCFAVLAAVGCLASCATSSTARLVTTDSQSESGFSTDIISIDGKPPTGDFAGFNVWSCSGLRDAAFVGPIATFRSRAVEQAVAALEAAAGTLV
jgi:hypothetical protein